MTDVWPLRPNWKSSYSVTYAFLTNILTSRSGREQRRALRQTPRKSVQFGCTAAAARFRALVRTLSTKQGDLLVFPEVTQNVTTSALSAISAVNFLIGEVPAWLSEDEQVVLAYGDRAELRTVASTGSLAVTFVEANSVAWPAGTRVCRALFGRLNDSIRLRQVTAGVLDGRISFDVEPGSETAFYPPEASVTWNGREVFLEPSNWANAHDLTFTRDVQQVDYNRGVVTTYLPVAFGTQARAADFLGRSPENVARIVNFFLRMGGRQGEFYAPTDEPDMVLAQNAASGVTIVRMLGTDLAAAYADDAVHQAICVLMTDGRRFYRTVETLVMEGGNSKLTLGSALPYAITPATVANICWLPVMRLGSDELTIEWLSDQVAQARLIFQTLEALPAE